MSEIQVRGPSAPAEPASKGLLARVVGVFVSPGETFEDIARKPAIIAPMLLMFISLMAMNFILTPIAGPEQADLLENSSRLQTMSEDQRAQILEPMRNPSQARIWAGAAGVPAGVLVAILFYALIFWGGGHLLGGEPTFKGVLSMLLFSALIAPVLATLVRLPLILVKESVFEVTISPAVFMPSLEVNSSAYLLLTIFLDVFYIWWVIVAGIGVSKVAKISLAAGVSTVAVVFLVRSTVLYLLAAISFG